MRRLAALLLLCSSAWAGYTSKATVSFASATGSTQTNITLAFTFGDTKLKTVSNGGQIQNTVTRVGVTVPADFVLTNDSTCASLTGSWAWGIESYSATAGTGAGWAKVASITTGAAVAPTVCIGNAAVTAYQGGAAGAEFDANTKAVYHFPDGGTLNAKDFSSSAHNGTVTSATAVTGKIDGAAGFSSAYIDVAQAAISGFTSATFSMWFKTTSTARQMVLGDGVGVCSSNGFASIETNNLSTVGALIRSDTSSAQVATVTSNGAWHRLSGIYTPTTLSMQLDGGAAVTTTGLTNGAIGSGSTLEIGNLCTNFASGAFAFAGSIDEVFIANVARSADWINTEYANQSSPPAIGAFTALALSTSQAFIF
jgi:hypothetical protein